MSMAAPDQVASARAAGAKPKLVLKSSEFRKGREQGWHELENLVAHAERRGVRRLSLYELQRLPLLYRMAISSLSVARTIALDRNLLLYLENLTLRSYLVVYGPQINLLEGLRSFFGHDLPAAVRAARWHIVLAALALLVGIAAGFMLVLQDEAWLATLIPSGLGEGRGASSTRAELLDKEIFAPPPSFVEAFGLFANVLFNHNTAVGLVSFGLGLAAGVPTVLLAIYNGLGIGAFVALHYNRGLTVDFLGWLTIHGTTELGALVLLSAGGLVVADKILFPGPYTRLENLALNGRQAAQVAVGAIVMLFVAAILEGVFRQLVANTPARFAIGISIGSLWIAYFSLCGRRAQT